MPSITRVKGGGISIENKDSTIKVLKADSVSLPFGSRELVGVELYVQSNGESREEIERLMQELESPELKFVSDKVRFEGLDETSFAGQWRCRFVNLDGKPVIRQNVLEVLAKAIVMDLDAIKIEELYASNEKRNFSSGRFNSSDLSF